MAAATLWHKVVLLLQLLPMPMMVTMTTAMTMAVLTKHDYDHDIAEPVSSYPPLPRSSVQPYHLGMWFLASSTRMLRPRASGPCKWMEVRVVCIERMQSIQQNGSQLQATLLTAVMLWVAYCGVVVTCDIARHKCRGRSKQQKSSVRGAEWALGARWCWGAWKGW